MDQDSDPSTSLTAHYEARSSAWKAANPGKPVKDQMPGIISSVRASRFRDLPPDEQLKWDAKAKEKDETNNLEP